MPTTPLLEPFGRSSMPPEFADRQTRVAMIGQVAMELIARGGEANLFVGGALLARLENGGSLERDYLKLRGEQGSHITATMLWRRIKTHSE